MDDHHDFKTPDLAELVGSRLCHDLVNPLSAISNGMELIGLSGAARSPELDLIGSAIEDAMARIRFFRVAFGAARSGEVISARELREIVAAIYGGGRLNVAWQIEGDLPRRDAKLAFLMLNCLETAFPLGGTLSIGKTGDAWNLTGEGRKLSVDPESWAALDPAAMLESVPPASRVQFSLLAKEIAHHPGRLTLSPDPDACRFTLTLGDA